MRHTVQLVVRPPLFGSVKRTVMVLVVFWFGNSAWDDWRLLIVKGCHSEVWRWTRGEASRRGRNARMLRVLEYILNEIVELIRC